MSPVITATPEHEDGRVRILIDSPAHAAATVSWTADGQKPPEKRFWRSVTHCAPMSLTPLAVYHRDAPLNVELTYRALLYTLRDGLLFADEDYTETVTATLRPAEWRLR